MAIDEVEVAELGGATDRARWAVVLAVTVDNHVAGCTRFATGRRTRMKKAPPAIYL